MEEKKHTMLGEHGAMHSFSVGERSGRGNGSTITIGFDCGESQPLVASLKESHYVGGAERSEIELERLEITVTGEWEAAEMIEGLRFMADRLVEAYGDPAPGVLLRDARELRELAATNPVIPASGEGIFNQDHPAGPCLERIAGRLENLAQKSR